MGPPTAKIVPAPVECEDNKTDTENLLFMDNKSIKFNDGNDTNDSAVYMVPVSNGITLSTRYADLIMRNTW